MKKFIISIVLILALVSSYTIPNEAEAKGYNRNYDLTHDVFGHLKPLKGEANTQSNISCSIDKYNKNCIEPTNCELDKYSKNCNVSSTSTRTIIKMFCHPVSKGSWVMKCFKIRV